MSDIVPRQAWVEADGVRVFYRYANPDGAADIAAAADAPTVVLLHGFPASSFMFRRLIPLLARRGYRVVAPDLPGFGFTEVPPARHYVYTFASLATTFAAFVDALQLDAGGTRPFAAYIFDYGAPTALRFALARAASSAPRPPLAAIVTQNGNAYVDGLGAAFWAPLQRYWATAAGSDPWRAARDAIAAAALTLPATRAQYLDGLASDKAAAVPPETYHLDQALLDRPDNREHQLDLFYDYQTNVALYPQFQQYLRGQGGGQGGQNGPPVLALWGRHDTIFVPAGAEAFARDVPADRYALQWLEGGHFALETHEPEVAEAMDAFFRKHDVFASGA